VKCVYGEKTKLLLDPFLDKTLSTGHRIVDIESRVEARVPIDVKKEMMRLRGL
jgi:hypothetical protein